MPIYEYYCPDNRTVYQFYARSLAQARKIPACPDNPAFRMVRLISPFAVRKRGTGQPPGEDSGASAAGGGAGDARMEQAFAEIERGMEGMDENDPRAMARMMRRMADITGEPVTGEMEEVVRRLEEGTDPEELEDLMGGESAEDGGDELPPASGSGNPAEPEKAAAPSPRRPRPRRPVVTLDPRLHEFE